MCKAIKVSESKDQGFNSSHPFILSFLVYTFFIFASFFKSTPKSQTTMDKHKHKILVILVFFMAICQVEKINITQTNIEAQREERKMKKDKNIRFDLRFTLILQHIFNQNNNILLQQDGPKGCKLAFQVNRYLSSTKELSIMCIVRAAQIVQKHDFFAFKKLNTYAVSCS